MLSFDAAAAFADRDMVERLLNDLTIDHRAVIVLRFYLDLSVEEVAHILEIPIGTAKSRINRGIEALRGSMAARSLPVAGHAREGTA